MFILRDLLVPLQEVFSKTKQGAEEKSLVCIHSARGGGTVHIVNHFQFAACSAYIVRIADPESTVLYLYGKYNLTLEGFMENHVGTDSECSYRGTNYCCAG